MKEGDKVQSQYGTATILRVEKKPVGVVAGRYTIKTDDGQTIENYPGYLLRKI